MTCCMPFVSSLCIHYTHGHMLNLRSDTINTRFVVSKQDAKNSEHMTSLVKYDRLLLHSAKYLRLQVDSLERTASSGQFLTIPIKTRVVGGRSGSILHVPTSRDTDPYRTPSWSQCGLPHPRWRKTYQEPTLKSSFVTTDSKIRRANNRNRRDGDIREWTSVNGSELFKIKSTNTTALASVIKTLD